jgi:hypothetical protein
MAKHAYSRRCSFQRHGRRCARQTVVTHPMCWQHTLITEGLRVRPSKIVQAKKGLWTARRFKKGDLINEYKGVHLSQQQVDSKYGEYTAPYVVCNGNACIDACNPVRSSVARYANDCRSINRKNKECSGNNARLYVMRNGRQGLKATMSILPNREIFASYGRQYWDADRHPFLCPQ